MVDYSKKTVELSVDVSAIWKLQCQNLYNSKNLGVLAVRECIQNSLDAIFSAQRKGQINKESGRIDITTEGNTLVISDNGIGMDIKTLHEKFLNLGGTTKRDEDNVGGFGLAKAVILGCGDGFKIQTQDNVFSSEDLGKNPIQKQPYQQGTTITLYDVQTGTNTMIGDDPNTFKWMALDYILSSEVGNILITFNGKSYQPYFARSRKTHRTLSQFGISSDMVPNKTKIKVDVYKNSSSSVKYLYVRLRGLTQFKQYLGWNANCDIVVDFQTKIDPRSSEYPFSTNREGLKSQYQGILEAIRDTVAKSPLSISSNDEYKETFFDNTSGNAEQARAIAAQVSDNSVTNTAKELSVVISGMIPQGGYKKPTLIDRIKQYNESLEEQAKEQGVSVDALVKNMNSHSIKNIDNPLEYSWLIWENKESNYKRVNKSTLVEFILVWDSILNVMATHYQDMDGTVFYPGIVSKKDTLGLCVKKQICGHQRTYVMINPYEIPMENDTQIALYLMGLASHELAHFVCNTYEAHGETWAYTREAIMNANLNQINNIIKIVKSGKLRRTLSRMTKKDVKSKSNCPYDFKSMTLHSILSTAEKLGVNVSEYQNKYSDERILRMRLVMTIKKTFD